MNELILPQNESLTMLSYDLLSLVNIEREKFGENPVRQNQFNNRIIDELEGDDCKSFVVENPNKTTSTVYELTIDQCMLISMRESKSVRKSVLAMLNKTNKPFQIPQTLGDALQLAADQAKQLELQAPKVEFVNRYVESTGNKSFRQVAKLLKANEREFRVFLVDTKVMYLLGDEWAAYQNHINAGRFFVSAGVSAKNDHAFNSSKFTPKGIEYIAGKWIAYKELSE